MIQIANPPVLLLALPLLGMAVIMWWRGYVSLSRPRRWVALAIRLALLLALVLGLAGISHQLPQSRQAEVFVADLSASDSARASGMAGLINAAASHEPRGSAIGVVTVGQDALVEQPVQPLSHFDGFQTTVDANYTDLERGLELAGAIMPDGYRRRVVLLSDGQQNLGDALSAARLLRAGGVRVDVVPEHVAGG